MDDVTLPPHPPTTPHGEPVPVPGLLATADPHVVPSEVVANLRDVGGRRTRDGGTVRRGVALRSAELRAPGVAHDAAIAALGVRTVVDLRTDAERAAAPDVLPDGARAVTADVLSLAADAPAADLTQLAARPHAVEAALAALDPVGRMRETYVELVVSDAARRGYATLLRTFLEPGATPVLLHCTAGKDRTGWGTTVLLLAVGVDEAQARAEYLAVDPAVRAMYAPLLDRAAEGGVDPALVEPLLTVREEYLDAALEAVTRVFGSVDGYLRDGLGLSDDELAELRAVLVEAPTTA